MRKSAENYKKSFYGRPERFEAPFTSIAEDLLKCLKEGLVGELIVISSYRKGKPNAVEAKKAKIQRTFGKFPSTKLELTETAKDLPLTQREKIIENKYSNFDILVDDSLKAINKTRKIFLDRKFVCPNYKYAQYLEKDIYLVSISLSNLKDEDFVKAAEEYKQKQQTKSAPASSPKSNPEREREREYLKATSFLLRFRKRNRNWFVDFLINKQKKKKL